MWLIDDSLLYFKLINPFTLNYFFGIWKFDKVLDVFICKKYLFFKENYR